MADQRWLPETLFDDLGFRMTFAADKVLYEQQTEHQHLVLFEQKLLEAGVLDAGAIEQVHEAARSEVEAALDQALSEPQPAPADVEKYTYAPSPVDAVYPRDYTGLP